MEVTTWAGVMMVVRVVKILAVEISMEMVAQVIWAALMLISKIT
jgi:hypothetical protein